jgi:diguanylate cyclase (GGDEF)-like protein
MTPPPRPVTPFQSAPSERPSAKGLPPNTLPSDAHVAYRERFWKGLRRPYGITFAIVLGSLALIATCWLAVLAQIHYEHQDNIDDAIERNKNLAIAFEQYSVSTIKNAEAAALYIKREYAYRGKQIDLKKLLAEGQWDGRGKDKLFSAAIIFDEHGDFVASSSRSPLIVPKNIADREHFAVHAAQDSGKIFIGKPVSAASIGRQLIPLTRRINKPDGSFGGIVDILIEPAQFTEFQQNAIVHPDDAIVLVGLDGIARARQVGHTLTAAEDYRDTYIVSEARLHASGNVKGQGKNDHVLRLYSYRALYDYPLIAVVGVAEKDVLAHFSQRKIRYFWGAGIVTLLIAMFATLMGVAHRRQTGAVAQLLHLAHFDTLTGLPNRRLFYEALSNTLAQARENNWVIAVLFIDLDRFKNINDTLGHAIGDDLLRKFGNRLFHCLRNRDTIGRLGGDEFTVTLVLPRGHQGAVTVANKIREALRKPFDLNGHEISVTASIGITYFPDDGADADTLLKYADTAMYRAKDAGRDTYRFFTAAMNAQAMARLDLEHALRKALDNDEFVLYYQPKIAISSGHIIGVEALIRWNRPDHGLVFPGDFIPLLEETGLIGRVGSWVIDNACKQIAIWEQGGVGPIHVSINVSGIQFFEGSLESDILQALKTHAISPELLELELTETSLMSNVEDTIGTLRNLKELGIRISIDDFGTGYSSLAYLKRFPIDTIKIDRAFIRDVTTDADDAAIVLAIINMAHSLKLNVIAEGVETAEQLDYLQRHGCDQIQGYYFSRPVPPSMLEQIVERENKLLLAAAASVFVSAGL